MKDIYTIGHSNYEMDYFLKLLNKFQINCIIDIRSVPYSAYVPHFNKEYLKTALKNIGVYYIYMGEELGIIQKSPSLKNAHNFIDFSKVQKTNFFKDAIERIETGLKKGYIIAIMCSEKDPFQCHRTVMITPILYKKGYNIIHILEDGSTMSQKDFDEKLIDLYYPKNNQENFFHIIEPPKSYKKLLLEAYENLNKYLVKNIE